VVNKQQIFILLSAVKQKPKNLKRCDNDSAKSSHARTGDGDEEENLNKS